MTLAAFSAGAARRIPQELGQRRIFDNERIAGFLVSKERMEAIIETLEILANRKR